MADKTRAPRARTTQPKRSLLSRFLREWAPLIVLAAFSFFAWRTADQEALSAEAGVPIAYENELETPLFSARRAPETLQAPIADAELEPTLDATVEASTATSCLVVEVENRLVEEYRPDLALVPASNQKVVSTWAALAVLGPEHRFHTSVRVVAPPVGGVVTGDVFLVGGGDPFLGTDAWWSQYGEDSLRPHTRLEALADAVVAAGVSEIAGGIVGDEGRYDSERTGPWAERLIESRQSGPLSALAVNQGFVNWPATYAGSAWGRVPSADPPTDAAATFAALLVERGVVVTAEARSGLAPAEAEEIAGIDSPALTEIITHVNSYSDNFGAELLVKEIGLHGAGRGSTESGSDVILQRLEDAGLPTNNVVIDDGSGLAESNRLTCRLLADLIQAAGPESALVQSFAIGGERGSLASRHVGTPAQGHVYAKTGTLNDVTALSGMTYSTVQEGIEITFAYIVNGEFVGQNDEIRGLQIPLVEDLVIYPEGPSIEVLSPLPPEPSE